MLQVQTLEEAPGTAGSACSFPAGRPHRANWWPLLDSNLCRGQTSPKRAHRGRVRVLEKRCLFHSVLPFVRLRKGCGHARYGEMVQCNQGIRVHYSFRWE